MSRLKQCPFCWGEVPRVFPIEMKGKAVVWRVHCPECGAYGPAEASLDEAIRNWNLRGKNKDLAMDEMNKEVEE